MIDSHLQASFMGRWCEELGAIGVILGFVNALMRVLLLSIVQSVKERSASEAV